MCGNDRYSVHHTSGTDGVRGGIGGSLVVTSSSGRIAMYYSSKRS